MPLLWQLVVIISMAHLKNEDITVKEMELLLHFSIELYINLSVSLLVYRAVYIHC